MSAKKSLRFASLVRVSTEQQEKIGESLSTQRQSNTKDVALLEGRIVEWYGGQEHATPGHEKKEIDRLLNDAVSGKFDAIIVNTTDRWSRDNEKSTQGLDLLLKANVKFFVSTSEHDLRNPEHRLILGMMAEFGKFIANHQSKKSMLNRIARASRGIPTVGMLPFARTFDKKTGAWGVIPEKKAMIQDIAQRYLKGEPLTKLSEEYGQSQAYMCRVFKKQCGTEWFMKFNSEKFAINERILITIPPLLSDDLIADVKAKLVSNRTRERKGGKRNNGQPINDYLLGGFVHCAACGYRMTGQTNHHQDRHYRHNVRKRERDCPLKPRPWVKAEDIEQAVIDDLFELFGNPAAIERSIKSAVPDSDKSQKRRERLREELEKIGKARDRILGLVEKEAITDDQAETKLKELKERQHSLSIELDKLDATLAEVPSQEEIEHYVENIGEAIIVFDQDGEPQEGGNDVGTFLKMTAVDKRKLIQSVFGKPMPDGTPSGVYITARGEGRKQKYSYELRGRFNWRVMSKPLRWSSPQRHTQNPPFIVSGNLGI